MAQAAATATKTTVSTRLPVWKWTGRNKQGEARSGEMEAVDREAVRARLQQMGIEPRRVNRKLGALGFRLPGIGGVSTKDLLVFTPQFRVMLMAVKARVEAGSTFADALAEHPRVFNELFVQLVRAGEIGGLLDTILQ